MKIWQIDMRWKVVSMGTKILNWRYSPAQNIAWLCIELFQTTKESDHTIDWPVLSPNIQIWFNGECKWSLSRSQAPNPASSNDGCPWSYIILFIHYCFDISSLLVNQHRLQISMKYHDGWWIVWCGYENGTEWKVVLGVDMGQLQYQFTVW